MICEQTIIDSVSFEDTTLHSGESRRLTFHPAPPGSGVSFRRVDLPGTPEIRVGVDAAIAEESYRRTTIASPDGVRVHTVEHILSALYGLVIDNISIEIDGDEAPFADGSAQPFVELLLSAGIRSQDRIREHVVIDRPIHFHEHPDVSVAALPWDGFAITFFVEYKSRIVNKQEIHLSITPEVYRKEIAPARTYCFFRDIEEMRAQDLIKGGNLDRAIVIGEDGILNDSLRFPDEIIRHKVQDIIGDLALIGNQIKGHIIAKKSGHRAHVQFIKMMKESLTDARKESN